MKSVFNKTLIIALCLSASGMYAGGDFSGAGRPVNQGWFARAYQTVESRVDRSIDSVVNWTSNNRKKTYAALFFGKVLLDIELTTGDISNGMMNLANASGRAVKDFGKKTLEATGFIGSQIKNSVCALTSVLKNQSKTLWVNHPRLCIGAGALGLYGLTLAVMIRKERLREQRQAEMEAEVERRSGLPIPVLDAEVLARLSRRNSQDQVDSSRSAQNVVVVQQQQTDLENRGASSRPLEVDSVVTVQDLAVTSEQARESVTNASEEQDSDSDMFYDASEEFVEV